MNATVCFFDAHLSQARRLQHTGQAAQAIQVLSRLLTFDHLPPDCAAEAHTRLGELHLGGRRYAKARRHLRKAMRLLPDTARLHHRLGRCLASDGKGREELALRHFRRALLLDASRPRWRAEAGLLAVRLGRQDEGLVLLRQAHDQAAEDVVVLGRLVKGLCQCGQPEEALRQVRLARFRAPRCGRLQKLEADLLLARLRRTQDVEAAQHTDEAVLLPFAQPELELPGQARYDGPHTLPGPHLVHIRARAGRRLR